MAFLLAFVKVIFEPKKIYLDEDDENIVTENNEIVVESVKLGKRKKII